MMYFYFSDGERFLRITIGITTLVLLLAGSAGAETLMHDPWVIEEGYDGAWWAGPENFIGQSFHVYQTGILVSATLRLSRGDSSSGIFDINIYEFSEDTNETSVKLASTAVDVASMPIDLLNTPSKEFIFSDSVITLTPGKTYLLAIEPRPDFTWVVFSQATRFYSEGQLYFHNSQGWQSYGGDDMEFGITYELTPTPTLTGSISGYKINDIHTNGKWDVGEKGILNWTIRLIGITGTGKNTSVIRKETFTDAMGFYKFDNLSAGRYFVIEKLKKGFVPTSSPVKHIRLAEGENIMNNNFTNRPVHNLARIDDQRDVDYYEIINRDINKYKEETD